MINIAERNTCDQNEPQGGSWRDLFRSQALDDMEAESAFARASPIRLSGKISLPVCQQTNASKDKCLVG